MSNLILFLVGFIILNWIIVLYCETYNLCEFHKKLFYFLWIIGIFLIAFSVGGSI